MWSRIIVVAFWFALAALFVLAAAGCASPIGIAPRSTWPSTRPKWSTCKLQCVEAMLKLDAIYRRVAGETLQ